MRDLDLVVSVAFSEHQPPPSHATLEMLAALIQETCTALQLTNVTVKDNRAIVEGTLARYAIHWGSAAVHIVPGMHVCIVPVRDTESFYLPFSDEDPGTRAIEGAPPRVRRSNQRQGHPLADQEQPPR